MSDSTVGHGEAARAVSDPLDVAGPTTGGSPLAKRVEAMELLLVEKGVVGAAEIQQALAQLASATPANGGRLIARAWVDLAFKARLLADPKLAAAELGLDASGIVQLVVAENTETIHHVVVCTLCSCSPVSLLGPPPDWYKSLSYRSRVVVEPRSVLREFGLDLAPDVEVRVLDSTTEVRYLVLPPRPTGTDHLSEDELAKLVTWEHMCGVAEPIAVS